MGGHPDASLAASRARSRARPVISIDQIEFRTVHPDDPAEYRAYMRLFWDIQIDLNPTFTRRTDEWLDNWVEAARVRETHRNARNGVALHDRRIVGLYAARTHDAHGRLVAHVAGLWVHEDYRRIGIAARLREEAEAWARGVGAEYLEANVDVHNARMLELSRRAGFEVVRLNLRKEL